MVKKFFEWVGIILVSLFCAFLYVLMWVGVFTGRGKDTGVQLVLVGGLTFVLLVIAGVAHDDWKKEKARKQ